MGTFRDLTGQRFGKLIVIEKADNKNRHIRWRCVCDCGKETIVYSSCLTKGVTKSCGCLKTEIGKKHLKDLTGQKFGRLTVIRRDENKGKTTWLCKCDCGNTTIKSSMFLHKSRIPSCGCYTKERRKEISDSQRLDLTNKRFGKLTVIKREQDRITPHGNKIPMWLCQCDCGNKIIVQQGNLMTDRHTMSCGCHRKTMLLNRYVADITGQKFGKLTVLERADDYICPISKRHEVMWKCVCDCGNIVSKRGISLRKGDVQSCGCDNRSHGEIKIESILSNYNISYVSQIKFDDLIGDRNSRLSYDFYLPDNNLLIEYQGIQHYKPVERFGGEKSFIVQQENDKSKREYAQNNNYKLLEIPYWEFDNIENILNKYIKNN